MMILRLVIACLLLSLTPAGAYFFSPGGGSPSSGGGSTVETTTFYNSAGTTSPATSTPIQSGLWVNEASIPSGMIATPSVGGTTLAQWQVDSIALPWTDGSVRGGSFSAVLPATTAGHGTQQVTWTLASGSWPTASSGTIGDVTSETHLRLVLSAVSTGFVGTYQEGMPVGTLVAPAITPGGGALTAIAIRQKPILGYTCASPGFGDVTGCAPGTTTVTASSTGTTVAVANRVGSNGGQGSQMGVYDVTSSTVLGQLTPSSSDESGPGNITLTAPATVTNGDTIQFFYAVSGCGTGASVPLFSLTTSGGLPSGGTVKSGGNCPAVGSGAYVFDIDSIIAGTSGTPIACDQAATNSQVCQYAKGNVKDGYRIYGDFIDQAAVAWAANTAYASGTQRTANGNLYTETVASCTSAPTGAGPTGRAGPSGLITGIVDNTCRWNVVVQPIEGEAWVERWKKPDGSTLAYQIVFATAPSSIYVPLGTTASYTFTADLMDGATEIHGAAGGDAGWSDIVSTTTMGEWFTLDSTYQPFWYQVSGGTGNDAGWNDVVVSLSAADKAYWKSAHVFAPPSDKLALSLLTPTNDGTGNMTTGICPYIPYAQCDIDAVGDIGNGGSHAWDGPMSTANISHYMAQSVLAGGGGDGGRAWLQDSDAGAANEMGFVGPLRMASTFHPVDLIPAGSAGWTAPASFVDPVYQSSWIFSGAGPDMNTTGTYAWQNSSLDAEHNPNLVEYPYIMQGYRYLLDSLSDLAGAMAVTYPYYRRTTAFGGTTYNGALGEAYVVRSNAWLLNQEQDVAIFTPPASDIEQYYYYIVKNTYDAEAAFYPFSGTVCAGVSCFYSGNKVSDLRAGGMWLGAQNAAAAGESQPGTWFMEGYMGFVVEKAKMLFAGAIPSIDTDAGYLLGNFLVADPAENCIYSSTPYTWPYTPLDMTVAAFPGVSNSTVASPQIPTFFQATGNLLNSISGDPVFSAAYSAPDVGGIGAAPFHSTATANASGTSLSIASVGTITAGAQVYDLTTPAAVPAHTYVATGGTTTLTLSAATTIASGDSIGFSRLLNFPDTYSSPAIPSGSLFTPVNVSSALEESPNPYTTGTAPPTGFAYGSWYVWTQSDASGTSGTLSPFGGGGPITPTTTGSMNWGFVPNTTCPPATAGQINDGASDYQDAGARLAEEYAIVNIWAALTGDTGQAATAITKLTPYQTPISIYTASAGAQKWLYDSTFSYNP